MTRSTDPIEWTKGTLTSQVEARVGRPVTPISAAGVARRTTRRVVRRSTVYIATLPAGCSTVIIDHVQIYSCGGVYYQPDQGQYVVVTIDRGKPVSDQGNRLVKRQRFPHDPHRPDRQSGSHTKVLI